MFDINVSDEQYKYAFDMVNKYNFGQRGYGDGNKKEQLTGIIGQTVLSDLIKLPRPDGSTGFDGGQDFIINNRSVDIKTMSRTVPMRDYFVHNFVGYQKNYKVDYYIFASFNTRNRVLTICGYVNKHDFFDRATFFPKGSLRYRADGTSFETFAPLYEIEQSKLDEVTDISDLISKIE